MKTYTETVFFLHVECVHTDEIKNICSCIRIFIFIFIFDITHSILDICLSLLLNRTRTHILKFIPSTYKIYILYFPLPPFFLKISSKFDE